MERTASPFQKDKELPKESRITKTGPALSYS